MAKFMAFVVATIPTPLPHDWKNHKKWYATLHSFDENGKHLDTKATFTGLTADGEGLVFEKGEELLSKMLSSLGEVIFGDIEIELFSVEIDGYTFGLVDASEPEENIERIDLLPNDLAFFAPWNGEYDT
jgi:formate hydrogenlyase regulatory protein HycA